MPLIFAASVSNLVNLCGEYGGATIFSRTFRGWTSNTSSPRTLAAASSSPAASHSSCDAMDAPSPSLAKPCAGDLRRPRAKLGGPLEPVEQCTMSHRMAAKSLPWSRRTGRGGRHLVQMIELHATLYKIRTLHEQKASGGAPWGGVFAGGMYVY